ncbi:hypothetical protein TIFTF001_016650 [Ficus carica]|uniref:Ubiquitin-like domain-containing protein n=1 Tax=Ficus carica TaxID=3494 RepID=A0AA88DIW0_FICCA|nr:hypothetical protein TIFTF001_016650 [Ficus carica]
MCFLFYCDGVLSGSVWDDGNGEKIVEFDCVWSGSIEIRGDLISGTIFYDAVFNGWIADKLLISRLLKVSLSKLLKQLEARVVQERMASSGTDHIPGHDAIEGSEATIEIKIKTLDSQTYTLRVDRQMPVPALKEQIASVTGVLSEQQRLICRGKVLKDDQLLSAYHVEDGHTLHLVVRQPIPPSSEGLSNHSGLM